LFERIQEVTPELFETTEIEETAPSALFENEEIEETAFFSDTIREEDNNEIKRLQSRIYYLESKISAFSQAITLKARSSDAEEDVSSTSPPLILHWRKAKQDANDNFKDAATEALHNIVVSHGTRFSSARVAELLVLVVWNFAGGICKPFLVSMAKEWLRKHVFTPWAILREMDLAGGTLSYEGIEVLRKVETKGKKCFRGSVIPSSTEIQRAARMVERFAHPLCPFELKRTELGEVIQFDIAITVRTNALLNCSKLEGTLSTESSHYDVDSVVFDQVHQC
jgi:hypothetical protein